MVINPAYVELPAPVRLQASPRPGTDGALALAGLAHLVLPCTHFLEDDDLVYSSWSNYLFLANQAVPPPGQCKPDYRFSASWRRSWDCPDFSGLPRTSGWPGSWSRPLQNTESLWNSCGRVRCTTRRWGRWPGRIKSLKHPPASLNFMMAAM